MAKASGNVPSPNRCLNEEGSSTDFPRWTDQALRVKESTSDLSSRGALNPHLFEALIRSSWNSGLAPD